MVKFTALKISQIFSLTFEIYTFPIEIDNIWAELNKSPRDLAYKYAGRDIAIFLEQQSKKGFELLIEHVKKLQIIFKNFRESLKDFRMAEDGLKKWREIGKDLSYDDAKLWELLRKCGPHFGKTRRSDTLVRKELGDLISYCPQSWLNNPIDIGKKSKCILYGMLKITLAAFSSTIREIVTFEIDTNGVFQRAFTRRIKIENDISKQFLEDVLESGEIDEEWKKVAEQIYSYNQDLKNLQKSVST